MRLSAPAVAVVAWLACLVGVAVGADYPPQGGDGGSSSTLAEIMTNGATSGDDLTMDAGHQVLADGGSEAAPGLAIGDGDSGVWESADDILQIVTAGTLRVTIGTNVGVSGNGQVLQGFRDNVISWTLGGGTLNSTTHVGGLHNTEGALGDAELDLPAGDTGLRYRFASMHGSNHLRVDPEAGDKFIQQGVATLADGEYLQSTDVGAVLEVVALPSGDWLILDRTGSWTEESP